MSTILNNIDVSVSFHKQRANELTEAVTALYNQKKAYEDAPDLLSIFWTAIEGLQKERREHNEIIRELTAGL